MINEVATATLEQAGANVLSAAIGVLGSRLAAAVTGPRGRKAEDLSIARWFETYKLTRSFPELPGLSEELASRLTDALGGDAVQAALQELLAVRLTDADDVEAARAREVFCLTLTSAHPSLSPFGPPLAEYYDDEISSLVARLEAAEPAMLAQIRSEALSARMISVLRAIERHTAALNARPNARTQASFLASYRSHVLDRHGKLEPPDFDRRRRVPIADIYVPPTIYENTFTERAVAPLATDPPSVSVWDLARRLDRTVLLGDPGGGKTTASNVLMHYFASDASRRIPFLVTLRNYAASDPPEYSVVGYIENELSTFYQCPAPPGVVDMLLLTGQAVVLFDGLDELLDTTRRADVASRVEHFCHEYPLAPVLVTSRVVGYDQARLDESQFVSYRLGGFRDEDVTDYARKWFALEEGARRDEADAFLSESESVPDLRANPLLLSLMCILYRGEGSLPRNRAEVYEQCSKLLFKRWDAHRHIHQELRAGRYVEQILRHLAWWLFTRSNTQAGVTERELVATTTEFLHSKGFESEDDARDAACEFIEFSRSRLWVFSDAGTTATGERLYAFTHRTFLEYFAASQLAYDSDTPERLARTLAPHIARSEWEVVGEIAIQIKEGTSRDGSRRAYRTMLDDRRRRSLGGRSNILQFLARTLRSVDPSPQVTRQLTSEIVQFLFSGDADSDTCGLPLAWLLASCGANLAVVTAEIDTILDTMITSHDSRTQQDGQRLAVSLDVPVWGLFGNGPNLPSGNKIRDYWADHTNRNIDKYEFAIVSSANQSWPMRQIALSNYLISYKQALEMEGGLRSLLQDTPIGLFGWGPGVHPIIMLCIFGSAESSYTVDARLENLAVLGQHFISNPLPPWVHGRTQKWSVYPWDTWAPNARQASFSPEAYLGASAILFLSAESDTTIPSVKLGDFAQFGQFQPIFLYIERRHAPDSTFPLPDLPVPDEFKQLFRDWAEGKVNFTAPAPDSPDQS